MKTKFVVALFLFLPSLSSAFQSPLDSEADCNAWKSSMMGWFRENHVQLVGKEREIIVACNEKDGRWTGHIAYRMSEERARKVAAISRNLYCAAPGGGGTIQRGIASESPQILDSPCKIAANDIKLFQKELSAPVVRVNEGMFCCGGKSWIGCGMAAAVEPLCKIKCGPCAQVSPGGLWR